jgi:hypothetical protein
MIRRLEHGDDPLVGGFDSDLIVRQSGITTRKVSKIIFPNGMSGLGWIFRWWGIDRF